METNEKYQLIKERLQKELKNKKVNKYVTNLFMNGDNVSVLDSISDKLRDVRSNWDISEGIDAIFRKGLKAEANSVRLKIETDEVISVRKVTRYYATGNVDDTFLNYNKARGKANIKSYYMSEVAIKNMEMLKEDVDELVNTKDFIYREGTAKIVLFNCGNVNKVIDKIMSTQLNTRYSGIDFKLEGNSKQFIIKHVEVNAFFDSNSSKVEVANPIEAYSEIDTCLPTEIEEVDKEMAAG